MQISQLALDDWWVGGKSSLELTVAKLIKKEEKFVAVEEHSLST